MQASGISDPAYVQLQQAASAGALGHRIAHPGSQRETWQNGRGSADIDLDEASLLDAFALCPAFGESRQALLLDPQEAP